MFLLGVFTLERGPTGLALLKRMRLILRLDKIIVHFIQAVRLLEKKLFLRATTAISGV